MRILGRRPWIRPYATENGRQLAVLIQLVFTGAENDAFTVIQWNKMIFSLSNKL